MPYQLKHIQVCLAKVEATEGVDATPAAADGIRLLEAAGMVYGAEEINDRPDLHNQLLDEAGPVDPGAKYVEFTGRCNIRGLGATYTTTSVPELHAILQGVGLSATFAAAAWKYDTASTLLKSLTMKIWTGTDTGVHVLHTLLGGRVSRLRLLFAAGKPAVAEFTVRGLYVAPSDTAVINPAYPSQTVEPRVNAATSFTLGALANAVLREAEVSYENTLQARRNANATDGLGGYAIVSRRVNWGARFESARIADYDAFTKWLTAVYDTLDITVPGGAGTAFNRFKFAADKAAIMDAPTYQDDNGIYLFGLSGKCTPEGTDRALITFD